MTSYTTIDDVAARFPNFVRSGASVALVGLARVANLVTATATAAPPFGAGWNVWISGTVPAGGTTFDGSFQDIATGAPAATFTFAQFAADDTATGGLAIGSPKNKIGDGQIQNWIWQTADFIEAVALSRGYGLGSLAADAQNILANLNMLAAQIRLGEAINAHAGNTGAWALLDGVRADYAALLKAFQRGDFDKNFLGSAAKTQDAGPQLGGYAPGGTIEPDNKYSITPPRNAGVFRKGQRL